MIRLRGPRPKWVVIMYLSATDVFIANLLLSRVKFALGIFKAFCKHRQQKRLYDTAMISRRPNTNKNSSLAQAPLGKRGRPAWPAMRRNEELSFSAWRVRSVLNFAVAAFHAGRRSPFASPNKNHQSKTCLS